MSAQLKSHWLSVPDYLAFEENSEIKHEYINGEIYAMAGTSVLHNRITLNLAGRMMIHLLCADRPVKFLLSTSSCICSN